MHFNEELKKAQEVTSDKASDQFQINTVDTNVLLEEKERLEVFIKEHKDEIDQIKADHQ